MTGASQAVAKVLGIKLLGNEPYRSEVTHETSLLMGQTGAFVEQPPSVWEYVLGLRPTRSQVPAYLSSLFPFLSWIGHYNLQWLLGDLVAGKKVFLARDTALLAISLLTH